MATKTTATAATAAAADGKGAGAAQIMQNLITINATLAEVMEKLKTLKVIESGQATNNAAVLKMETEMAVLSAAVKAMGAQKRAPKAPATGDGAAAGAAVPSAPTGEKFPSTSYAWFANIYKRDPAGASAKYFVDAQIKAMRDKLATNDAYNKLNVSTGTPEAQEKAKSERLVLEAKALVEIVKSDPAIAAKMKQDWSQAKSDWDKKSRTAAPKDGEAAAAPATTS